MNTLVVYDSNYGNTKIIADTVAKKLQGKVMHADDFTNEDLKGIELLIVGSPINGWRPTERINKFLKGLNSNELKGMCTAAFDTRVKLFIHGDAAGKISKALESAGGKSISSPKGFIVKGGEGPLADGETDKALAWAKELMQNID